MNICLCTALLLTTIIVSPSGAAVSEDFKSRFLAQINKIRAKYCAQPLIWDQNEADLAASWAYKRANNLTNDDHGDFDGTQNAFGSLSPEKCGKAGHSEIVKYVQLSSADIINKANDYENWGHYANQVSRKVSKVGVGWETGVRGTFCIVNMNILATDYTDYGPSEWNVFPNTCRLAEPSCAVEPNSREDCTWNDTDYTRHWTEADCLSINCCYDNSTTGKPKCFYPVEAGTAKRCSTPDFAKSGENAVYSDPIGPTYKPGTTVTLTCKFDSGTPGLVLPTSTCQRNGTWTPISSKCPHFCGGPISRRISPKIPYTPVDKWTKYFCTHLNHSNQFCYDAETNSCFYPFTEKPQCDKPEHSVIAGRQQFQVVLGDVILPPQFTDTITFPYPVGTVANLYCPDPTIKSTITCNAHGNWTSIKPYCPYTCDGPIESRIAPYPDWQPPSLAWCIGHGYYNCWDADLQKCYRPFQSGYHMQANMSGVFRPLVFSNRDELYRARSVV